MRLLAAGFAVVSLLAMGPVGCATNGAGTGTGGTAGAGGTGGTAGTGGTGGTGGTTGDGIDDKCASYREGNPCTDDEVQCCYEEATCCGETYCLYVCYCLGGSLDCTHVDPDVCWDDYVCGGNGGDGGTAGDGGAAGDGAF